jgi:hypothetical protein
VDWAAQEQFLIFNPWPGGTNRIFYFSLRHCRLVIPWNMLELCLGTTLVCRSGGLAVLWKNDSKCRVLNYSRNFINLIVEDEAVGEWKLTCYYGYPERARRREAWELLRELWDMSSLPRCIVGDFNDLLSQADKQGIHPHPNWRCSGFREAVNDCDLSA